MSANRSFDGNNIKTAIRDNVRQLTEKTHKLENNAKEAIRRLPIVLNEQEIRRLREHKYSSEGTTLFDPFMQKYWTWLVQFCPIWVAPNLITIVGLIINIGTSVLLMVLTDGGKEQCTPWMYFFTALGLFIYQSLDAIDGKQARRTKTSSPLGELFDHGCDSVSTVFVTIACCCAVQLGLRPWLMFWCCMFAYLAFYCAHWQTYVSGKLRFGKMDCTEAQFSFIVTYILSILFPNLWSKTIPVLDIECRVVAALLMLGSTFCSSMNNLHTVSQGGCGRNKSTVAGTSILFPVWPIGLLLFLAYIASNHSVSQSLQSHPALHLLCYGIVFSKITNRLIVAHMSKSIINVWDTAYIGPIAVCINQYFNCFIGEYAFFWLFLVFNLYDLLRYNVKVCQELCDAFGIYCFRITPPENPSQDNSH